MPAHLSLSTAQKTFLQLLSASLWGTAVENLAPLTPEQWQEVFHIARQQSVTGVVADVVLSLPEELLPPQSLLTSLILQLQQIRVSNAQLYLFLGKVHRKYSELGLPFVLLKGPTVAQHYPQPAHRMTGDLDLYLFQQGDYDRANAWAREKGYKMLGDSLYEQPIQIGQHIIENHLYIAYFGKKKYDARLAQYMRTFRENDSWLRQTLHGTPTLQLPVTFNAVYLFLHILHHFCYLGIGLRQVSDWLLFLSAHPEIEKAEFTRIAQDFDALRPMQCFATMAVRYLHAAPSIFPFDLPKGENYGDLVLEDILKGGNFGKEYFAEKQFSHIWARRWYMFRCTVKRSWKVAPISPEHIRSIPFVAIATRLKLLFK